MKNRTEELMEVGARQLSGGGTAPFVCWADEPSWIEGEVMDVWEGKYGSVARLLVTAAAEGLSAVSDGREFTAPQPGTEVNLGISAALTAVDSRSIGRLIHVAFEGWEDTRDGNRYRRFRVLEVPANGLSEGAG